MAYDMQIFFKWRKMWYSDSNFTEVCSELPNSQYVSFGLGSGLVTNMWPVIIWTSVYPNPWRFMASLYLNMLGLFHEMHYIYII